MKEISYLSDTLTDPFPALHDILGTEPEPLFSHFHCPEPDRNRRTLSLTTRRSSPPLRKVKIAGLYLVPIKSYSKNGDWHIKKTPTILDDNLALNYILIPVEEKQ